MRKAANKITDRADQLNHNACSRPVMTAARNGITIAICVTVQVVALRSGAARMAAPFTSMQVCPITPEAPITATRGAASRQPGHADQCDVNNAQSSAPMDPAIATNGVIDNPRRAAALYPPATPAQETAVTSAYAKPASIVLSPNPASACARDHRCSRPRRAMGRGALVPHAGQ